VKTQNAVSVVAAAAAGDASANENDEAYGPNKEFFILSIYFS
jgi:hypothetical protein